MTFLCAVPHSSDTDGCEQSEATSLQSLKPCTGETLNKKSSAQPQECATSEGPVLLKKNNRWRRKIRATFPLVLVKTQDTRTTATDKSNHSKTSEEEDSDFEEIFMPASENRHLHQDNPAELENPPETTQEPPTDLLNHHEPSTSEYMETENTGKKKLTLSLSEKEKLLDWELGVLREESSELEGRTRDPQFDKKPEDELPVDPPPAPAPTQSTLQIVMNTLRRSFRVPGPAAPMAVPRRNRAPGMGPLKTRPLSEGSFSFTSLFGTSTHQSPPSSSAPTGNKSPEVEGLTSTSTSASTSPSPGPLGSTLEGDLHKLMKGVSLSSRPPGVPRDDLAALPPRKLNFFSSMRVKRSEQAEREKTHTPERDVWSILTDLRKKVSSPQQQDSSSSSEEEKATPKQKDSSSIRQRRRQEKVVKQQARQEQLKRLHRAQVIQRQLEEVEEKQRALEEKGVVLEKLLRGETEDGSMDEPQLLQTWFKLELELEDTQSQLQQKLRQRMAIDDSRKSSWELAEEQEIFTEMMRVVEKRDALVSLLEEQRLKERAEDHDLESLVLTKGYQLHWT
ncbi:hypothetical protein JZ751_027098 [Albula glossodonta]|uniref:BMERB domain-containing protein n=1 Tax=Albula glossodonta TaxID=121402 RepID=A0A8T2NP24_9TELE|nr:hypothetical protein JZ751_027098 [Albula glossodonta]